MKKLALIMVGALGVASGAFAEDKNLVKNGDFESGTENWTLNKSIISEGGAKEGKKCLAAKNAYATAVSTEMIPVDPKGVYELVAKVKGKGSLLIGFSCYDKDKKILSAQHVDYFPKTQTALTADCKVGDKVLKVKDAKKWMKYRYSHAAFNIDDSGKFSDLPNRDLSPMGVTNVENKGDHWEITLAKPMKKAYGAGTKIRQHNYGAVQYAFSPIRIDKLDASDWKEFSADLEGHTYTHISAAPRSGKWRAGTAFVRVYCLMRAAKGSEIMIDNIELIKDED